jgi:hypothetical protein
MCKHILHVPPLFVATTSLHMSTCLGLTIPKTSSHKKINQDSEIMRKGLKIETKKLKKLLQSLDRWQGCFVGAIYDVGSASVLSAPLKRPETDDLGVILVENNGYSRFWLFLCEPG